jgi:hypothetical protein
MTALHSDLSADLGCGSNISTDAHALVSARIGKIRDIRALCWCPDVVIFPRVILSPHFLRTSAAYTVDLERLGV